jgi:putative heme-binding domain-containing protein
MQARGAEAILLGVLDPNREVQPQYVAHTAVTADGRVVTGLVVAESEGSVTIRSADGGEQTIARDDLDELSSTKKSLMPEGFERELDVRGMGDLLAWLMAAK